MGRSIALGGDPKGVQGGERKATLLASMGGNFAVRNSPLVGIDAPTPARIGTSRPKGRSHFSFGGERKVCKRKPAARRLREKALYCPFLKEGVRNVARSTVGLPTWTFVRARAHSFPLSKRARLFPSAAYRRSAPPQSAWGIRTPCGVRCFDVAWAFLRRKRRRSLLPRSWRRADAPLAGWDGLMWLEYFATQKASVKSKSRWPLLFNWQGTAPDWRAVAPVVPRR